MEDFFALDFLVEDVLLEAAAARFVVVFLAVFLAAVFFAPPRAEERAAVFFAAGFFAAVFLAAVFLAAGFLADFLAAPFDAVLAADLRAVFFAPDFFEDEEEEPAPLLLEPIRLDLSSDGISASFKSLRATTVTLDQGNVVITSEFRLTDSVERIETIFSVDTFNTRCARACATRVKIAARETRSTPFQQLAHRCAHAHAIVTRC